MNKRLKKIGAAAVMATVGLVASFFVFGPQEVEANPGTIEFVSDAALELSGLSSGIYIASGSKADYLTISGTDLSVYGVWDSVPFLVKTATYKFLQLTPSGGTVDFVFSSNYILNNYVSQWTENSSVSVTHVLGVPSANTNYTVKVNGVAIPGSPFNSGAGAEITFTRTGGGTETFTIIGSGYGFCSEHNVFGYAWSSNIGWISFSCTNESGIGEGVDYGVDIASSTGAFSGYAWSDNIGWINLAPEGTYPGTPSYSTKMDLLSNEVSGWARACTVFQAGCSGSLKPDSERGGWEGWIKMRDTYHGVSVSGGNGYFSGWAWSDLVVGWISFSHLDCDSDGDGVSDQGSSSQCPIGETVGDYNVQTSLILNFSPDTPTSNGETLNACAWGSAPQAALGTAVTFSWTYSDPDSDPQAAYEVEVDSSDTFTAPKFNHLVNAAGTSYVLDLAQDDNSDWISNLAWGTTYYWRVRVQDDQNNWSEWSDADSFATAAHAYPNPDFTHQPTSPSLGEEVLFIDDSNCYDSSNNPSPCKNVSGASYQWDFQDDSSIDSTAKGDATSTYSGTGSYSVRLYVTDDAGTCNTLGDTPIGVEVPLPKYKEIPPVSWLED